MTILDLRKKYIGRIAPLDLELLFSFVLNKSREFVLAHPEFKVTSRESQVISKLINRRIKNEPIAYILGKKEFYDLEFTVNKNTLIPRPETELLVDLALEEVCKLVRKRLRTINVIDVGTGSGNILISILSELRSSKFKVQSSKFFGIDISKKALIIAKKNAKAHGLDKKIKFIKGNLLNPIIGNLAFDIGNSRTIVLANLPYLSSEIYSSSPKDVRLYEPKTALYSPRNGLDHYTKLLKQIARCSMLHACLSGRQVSCFMEISPEQKPLLSKIIKQILPSAKVTFHQDLSRRWRVCQIEI